ncbi:MAG: hypothetical protein ABJN98_04320 [Roseibium sp.]
MRCHSEAFFGFIRFGRGWAIHQLPPGEWFGVSGVKKIGRLLKTDSDNCHHPARDGANGIVIRYQFGVQTWKGRWPLVYRTHGFASHHIFVIRSQFRTPEKNLLQVMGPVTLQMRHALRHPTPLLGIYRDHILVFARKVEEGF